MSMIFVTIGFGNGLSPVQRQAIAKTIAELLASGHMGKFFIDI